MGKPPGTNWEYLETARGTYDWKNLDRAVSYASAHNIPIFVSHEWVPQWAASNKTTSCGFFAGVEHCNSAPTDLNTKTTCEGSLAGTATTDCQWKEFLTSLVQRYRANGEQAGCTSSDPQCHGVIQMYEGWNEPPFPPSGGSGIFNNADFMTFETDFYDIVKANDSMAQVCSPAFLVFARGSQGDRFNRAFFAGNPPNYDCWDFHINDETPESQLADIRFLYSEGFPTGRVMYATEAGRGRGCNALLAPPLTLEAYVGRIELLYWSWGIKRHYWYAYGICSPLTNQPTSSTLTPAGIAYGNVESWMAGASMSKPCSANGTVWACGLRRPNGYQAMAVWDTEGSSTFAAPSQFTHYQDLAGNSHSLARTVTIGPRPILLTSNSSP